MWLDSHVHIWPGRDGGASVDELLAHWDRAGIAGGVAIQPRTLGADHSYLIEALARHSDRLRGVMLADPLRHFDPEAVRHTYAHGFQGIRLVALGHGRAEWLSGPVAAPVFRLAGELGAVVSLLVEAHQLEQVRACALRYPSVRIVVDHLGYCGWRARASELESLLSLAELPNVYLKVSAFGFLSRGPAPYHDLAGVIGLSLARFGAERLLWGTDFPHVLEYGPYELSRDAAHEHLGPAFRGSTAGLYGF